MYSHENGQGPLQLLQDNPSLGSNANVLVQMYGVHICVYVR